MSPYMKARNVMRVLVQTTSGRASLRSAGGGVAEFLKAEGGAAPLPARTDRIPDGQPISTTTDTEP